MKELWCEKYRPKTIKEYVFKNEHQKEQILKWIEEKSIPQLLFTGAPGTGKTSLAKILFNELNIHEFDILEINASRTNSIEDVRNKIVNFVQTMPFGDFKAVLLDESDFLSINSQAALRGLLEEYHSTARFIFTANYSNKIIPALHSRCQGFHIETLDLIEFTTKVAEILIAENIVFELDVLDTFVKSTYPDLRKCINSLQENSINGKLVVPETNSSSTDYKIKMVELFKEGKITEARKLLCSQARAEEMVDIYRWLYTHLEYLGKTEQQQEEAILIIKRGAVDHTLCIDPEINLSSVLIKLARNAES